MHESAIYCAEQEIQQNFTKKLNFLAKEQQPI